LGSCLANANATESGSGLCPDYILLFVVNGVVREAEVLIRKAAKDPEKARWVVVAKRRLAWRLVELAGKMAGVKYGSVAQGVPRFWRLVEEQGELKDFVAGMRDECK